MYCPKLVVIIPAYNEEKAIAKVIAEIPKDIVNEIIVVNNASTDATAQVASEAGATVIHESRAGYGSACLAGIEYLKNIPFQPDIVVFIDGDHSDFPEQIPQLIAPIIVQNYDMVVGSRVLGSRERGSLTPQQIFGNWLATNLIFYIYGIKYTDLGPFRAIKFEKLLALNMADTNYGWTVEMQIKAAKQKLKTVEIAVNYRNRIGFSKISGTIKGTFLAGYKIIATIMKYIY